MAVSWSLVRRGIIIEHVTNIQAGQSRPVQPRSIGTAAVTVRADDTGTTRISTLRQSGALKLVFPQTHRSGLEAISVNTSGGVTGGDTLSTRARVDSGAALTITSQAAERAYKAQPGEIGQVTTDLDVAANAELFWVPQELILFQGAALRRRLNITLAATSRLLMVETVVFGRAAMGEKITQVQFDDRIRITREGVPLYFDGLKLRGNINAQLKRPSVANGAGAMASLVFVDPAAASFLDRIRAGLGPAGGASLLAPDMIVLRAVATDSLELRRVLVPLLDLLTRNQLPLSWRL